MSAPRAAPAEVGAGSRGKVCHLTSVHRVNDIRIFHKECATLAAAGFDVTLIGVAADDVPERGVRVIQLPDEGSRFQRFVQRGREVYRRALAVEAQIYHFHDPELLPFGLMLKRRTGAKVIFDSHECFREDIVAKDWIPQPLRMPIGGMVGAIEDFVTARIDQVVAATPHIAESFAGHARKVVTITNYPLGAEFTAIDRVPGTGRAVCFVGALTFVRGLIPFLDSLSFVPEDVAVHIAGTFANAAIEQAMRNHPNWHRVTFHGQVGREQVAAIYADCFAGMVTLLPAPNHILAQPNKLFEYMSAGLPVICSHFPLWRSAVEEAGCGIAVDPADPRAIGAAITALHADRERARQMGERGIQLVRDRYNWEHEGRALVESYDALLAG